MGHIHHKDHKHKSHKHRHIKPEIVEKVEIPKSIKIVKSRPVEIGPKYIYIEDLFKWHAGEDIWIVCPGAAIDYGYPDNFFDNKTSIALKFALNAFPNCTYCQVSYYNLRTQNFIKKYWMSELERFIVHLERPKDLISIKPIYMRTARRPRGDREYYFGLPQKLLRHVPMRYLASGSLLQWAIQSAIIMGAKRVILVAGQHRGIRDQYHAQKRGMDEFYPESQKPPDKAQIMGKARCMRMSEQSIYWLAQAFKPHGVEILHHEWPNLFKEIAT